ncbi:MAG: N-acetyl-gamma-glutamyl-phosphate reductase, partial [Halanaerobiales bacterium]
NENTRVIDGSTAHRVADDWAYGIPEISQQQREIIRKARRVSVPGCHATGFVITVRPLVEQGIIPVDYPMTFHSVTGYSGGGKKLISTYESESHQALEAPRHYALGLDHKHLPEMTKHTGLKNKPLFTPIVSNFYKGMVVSIPLHTRLMNKYKSTEALQSFLAEYYQNEFFVKVMPLESEEHLYQGAFKITDVNNSNNIEIFIHGNNDQILIMTRLDNLGKGASGAAVQNMNVMIGVSETKGLV